MTRRDLIERRADKLAPFANIRDGGNLPPERAPFAPIAGAALVSLIAAWALVGWFW
nr:hypothetical protein [uncultured Roseovarius sp.]